jgi:hypothetical protein
VPFFCKHCGRIGHNHEECGDGVWSAKELQYGDFMLATRRLNPPPPEPRSFGPRGRGGRSGRGAPSSQPCKRSSTEAELDDNEDDLADSASSPLKNAHVGKGEEVREPPSAKKNLDFVSGDPGNISEGRVSGSISMDTPAPPPAYTDPRDRSKMRKTVTSDDLATSAASSEEDHRAQ